MSAVDNIEIQLEADAKQANSQLDKVIEKLGSLKNTLSGINTQKLKKEMQSFEDFQKQLQGLGQNVKVSGSIDGLKKQIEQAEARLDTLLKKENKLQTVGGIDQNSKSFRSLQYDIAEVCGQLDTLYAKIETFEQKKALNFWEKPSWYENLQKYGTTIESAINAHVETGNSSDQIDKIRNVAEDLKSSLDEMSQAMNTAGQTVQTMGGKLQAVKGIFQQISEAFSGFREKLSSGSGAEKFNSDMQSLIDGINQAKYTMKQMESGNVAFDSTIYERAARELSAASAQMQEYKNSLSGAAEQTSRLKAVLSGIGTAAKGAFAKLGSVGSSIVSACKTAVSSVRGLKASLPKLGAAFTSLGKKIKSVTRLFTFMVLRRAISALLSAMKEGFDNLARYSAAKGTEFNKNLSLMKSSLKQLGNSFVTIIEPIINVVAPILDVFLQKLISVTNVIAQFFAALTGKGTYTKAKKVVSDYAAELDGAAASAKKLATATTGIDELNILSDNSTNDSGSGLNSGGADAFETVPIESNYKDLIEKLKTAWKNADFSEIGAMLADSINKTLDSIDWKKIQEGAEKVAKCMGTSINGFVGRLDWPELGYTISQGINNALFFVNTILKTTDFKQIGKSIVDAIGGYFKNINWGTIGNTLSSAIVALANFLTGIIQEIDWAGIPGYILQSIQEFFKNFDWKGVSKSLGELLGSAVKGAVDLAGSIWDMLKEAWGNLSAYFDEYINEAGGDVIQGLFNGIVDALKNVGSWIKENLFSPFIDGFKEAFGIHSPSKEMMTMGGFVVEGFILGITGKLSDCLNSVKEWASKIKEWFSSNSFGGVNPSTWTTYANDIITGFKDKVSNAYTATRDKITTWASDIKEYFSGNGKGAINKNTWTTYADNVVSGFREKIGSAYTTVRTNITTWASDIKDYFTSNGKGAINSNTWTTYADNVVSGFREKIGSAYTSVRTNITTWASDLKSYFTDNGKGAINNSTWTTYAGNIISGFKSKISGSYTECQSSITEWASKIKTWFTDKCSSSTFYSVASDVIEGFKKGIGDLYDTCKKTIQSWGSDIISWFKDKLGINSPSKVFSEFGGFTVAGFNKGLAESGKATRGIVQNWADSFSSVDIGFKVGVDTSALKEYQNNYGADFANDSITARFRQEISAAGRTTIKNDSSYMGELFRQVIREELPIVLSGIAEDVKRQADKEEQTIVQIGGKTVTDAVETQQSANGYRFRPT